MNESTCFRCPNPATTQWDVCADGNTQHGLCTDCDVELNAMVLRWMRHPDAERLIAEYAAEKDVERPADRPEWLRAVSVLSVEPSDVVVVRHPNRMSPEMLEGAWPILRRMADQLGIDPARVIVMDEGMDIGVIRSPDAAGLRVTATDAPEGIESRTEPSTGRISKGGEW